VDAFVRPIAFAYTFAYLIRYYGFAVPRLDWDRGNRAKYQKHGLSVALIESVFARPLAVISSAVDSRDESRFCAAGQTGNGRRVFLGFTLRRKGDKQLIRPIGARYMHKKEIESYEEENPGV
jgi:uncharacterized DUF497 family protein